MPTLNPHRVMETGLVLGNQYCTLSSPPRAKFCIYQGMLGVMFTMPRRVSKG